MFLFLFLFVCLFCFFFDIIIYFALCVFFFFFTYFILKFIPCLLSVPSCKSCKYQVDAGYCNCLDRTLYTHSLHHPPPPLGQVVTKPRCDCKTIMSFCLLKSCLPLHVNGDISNCCPNPVNIPGFTWGFQQMIFWSWPRFALVL